ncbi:MAG: hypothetical protein ABW003_13615 [Microvirga sp.]
MRIVSLVAAIAFLHAAAESVQAAASQQPFQQSTINLRTASQEELFMMTFQQCVKSQAVLTNNAEAAMRGKCTCYAKNTFMQMTPQEVDYLRSNGYLDDRARQKALASLTRCDLTRPPGL